MKTINCEVNDEGFRDFDRSEIPSDVVLIYFDGDIVICYQHGDVIPPDLIC